MALEPPLRKVRSQNFDTIRPMNGYENYLSFMALAQTVFDTDQKNHKGGRFTPPPTSNRVKTCKFIIWQCEVKIVCYVITTTIIMLATLTQILTFFNNVLLSWSSWRCHSEITKSVPISQRPTRLRTFADIVTHYAFIDNLSANRTSQSFRCDIANKSNQSPQYYLSERLTLTCT